VKQHFATQYIGRRWKKYGRGPDAFDCWGLVMHLLAEHYGIVVEDVVVDGSNTIARVRAMVANIPGAETSKMVDWVQVEYPEDGDIVVMGNIHGVPSHCGLFLAIMGGSILHCEEGVGCVLTSKNDVRWPRLTYYRKQK
jgi:cell wall-associated NlpC family hydrolase